MRAQAPQHTNRGFTLIEILIVLGTLGVVLTITGNLLNKQNALSRVAYRAEQQTVATSLGEAMVEWAEARGAGLLPAPYTGGTLINAVVDPASVDADVIALRDAFTARGHTQVDVLENGLPSRAMRVYQLLPALVQTVPMFNATGPQAELWYDIGIIYTTACAQGDATCYPDPVTGIPGDSPVLTAANVATWVTVDTDISASRFSTLALQRSWLSISAQRVGQIRDALRNYFQAQFLATTPDPTINHYPASTDGGAPDLSGSDPAANDGCRDGWYDLGSGVIDVLAQIGLNTTEFGTTPWGGAIEYCRDYDVSGANGANAAPHNAALRVHRQVSRGISPGAPGDNLLFSL